MVIVLPSPAPGGLCVGLSTQLLMSWVERCLNACVLLDTNELSLFIIIPLAGKTAEHCIEVCGHLLGFSLAQFLTVVIFTELNVVKEFFTFYQERGITGSLLQYTGNDAPEYLTQAQGMFLKSLGNPAGGTLPVSQFSACGRHHHCHKHRCL